MAPPSKIHGTLISDLSEKGSGARIRWPANARLLMYAHLARHKLHLGNCQNHRFSELVQALDLDHGVEFNTAVHPRLQSALKYSLESLGKMGHVELSRGSQRRHAATWLPHTDTWAKPGWDGSLGGPESDGSDPGDEMVLDIEDTQQFQPSSSELQQGVQSQRLASNDRRDKINNTLQSQPSSADPPLAAQPLKMNTPGDFPRGTQQSRPSSEELRLAAQLQRSASNARREKMNAPANSRGPVMLPSHSKTTAPQTSRPTTRVGSGWLRGHQDGAIFPSLRPSAPIPNPAPMPTQAPVSSPARPLHPIPSAPITHRNVSQQTQQTAFTVPTTAFTTTGDFQHALPARSTPDCLVPSQGVDMRVEPSIASLPHPTVQTSQFQLRDQPEVQTGRAHDTPANKTASVINDIDRQHFLDMLSHQESVHNRIMISMVSLAFTDYLCKSHESGLRPGTLEDFDRCQRTIRLLRDQLRDLHSENERIEMTMQARFPFLQGLLNGSGLFSAVCKSMFS